MSDNTEYLLSDIDKRLTLVEADIARMAGTRKLITGTLAFLILQAVAGAVGYGELLQKVESAGGLALQQNTATALRVVQDHGGELENLRTEVARIRGSIDAIWTEQARARDVIAESTKSRFYREDAYPIYDRISALEGRVERNEGYIFGPAGAPKTR